MHQDVVIRRIDGPKGRYRYLQEYAKDFQRGLKDPFDLSREGVVLGERSPGAREKDLRLVEEVERQGDDNIEEPQGPSNRRSHVHGIRHDLHSECHCHAASDDGAEAGVIENKAEKKGSHPGEESHHAQDIEDLILEPEVGKDDEDQYDYKQNQ